MTKINVGDISDDNFRDMKTGLEIITDERIRQIEKEGWDSGHDYQHSKGELGKAASCYADPKRLMKINGKAPLRWPWAMKWWKPNKAGLSPKENRIRQLAKAGALIAAEIDRLQNS